MRHSIGTLYNHRIYMFMLARQYKYIHLDEPIRCTTRGFEFN